MMRIQKVCAAAIVPLAIVCGLIVDAHPWAAITLLLCSVVCCWVAVQEPPPPRVHHRTWKGGRDRG